jgi:histidine ammonia-lyase
VGISHEIPYKIIIHKFIQTYLKMETIIGNRNLTLDDFRKILLEGNKIQIGDAASERVEESYSFLKNFSKDKLIYGVNTGFGPMAQYRIADDDQIALQYNLIRSHCSGMGKTLEPVFTKALMVARLNTLLKGNSGVHPSTVELLAELINRDIHPLVYEHGSVGASGDLVQLAHLALCLIGEGPAMVEGEKTTSAEALRNNNLQPLKVHIREGLALMNGTSAMTGVGVVNVIDAQNLLMWSLLASSMIVELVESYDDHYSKELNETKHHKGQSWVAAKMRYVLNDSKLVRKRHEHLYEKKVTEDVLHEKVQEYYSIRCVPQILGPIYDTIMKAQEVVIDEVNSVNDNPVIDAKKKNVYHGGNFHGDYISMEMDKLKMAVTKMSMLSERQLNFLMNDKLNQKLPPFVNLGRLGFNLGMQGAQFVATSTVAESQTLSFPMSLHSIPNNNDNQDMVSMGTNSALLTSKVIENTYQVLAVQFLTVIQAIDYLDVEEKMSTYSKNIYRRLRNLVPVFTQDTVMNEKTSLVRDYMKNNHLTLANVQAVFADIESDLKLGYSQEALEDIFEVAVV